MLVKNFPGQEIHPCQGTASPPKLGPTFPLHTVYLTLYTVRCTLHTTHCIQHHPPELEARKASSCWSLGAREAVQGASSRGEKEGLGAVRDTLGQAGCLLVAQLGQLGPVVTQGVTEHVCPYPLFLTAALQTMSK